MNLFRCVCETFGWQFDNYQLFILLSLKFMQLINLLEINLRNFEMLFFIVLSKSNDWVSNMREMSWNNKIWERILGANWRNKHWANRPSSAESSYCRLGYKTEKMKSSLWGRIWLISFDWICEWIGRENIGDAVVPGFKQTPRTYN